MLSAIPPAVADLRLELLQAVEAPSDQRDRRALGGQCAGGRGADPRCWRR